MIYGYARVSSSGQARDGNGLEVQQAALRDAGAENIYSEHFTGVSRSRPELDKLLGVLKEGDTLVVTKLDRIARSTMHGLSLVEELIGRGIRVNILNMGVMDNTPASKLMRTMFFAFAEFERDTIVERTQEGKAIARRDKNYREGRKPVSVDMVLLESLSLLQRIGKITAAEVAKQLGISRSKYYELRKEVDRSDVCYG
jgi:DNA invertase Pin-like site-specific DNA recombinase